jgi:uncharacterized repeat protein (TIGR01451 family)
MKKMWANRTAKCIASWLVTTLILMISLPYAHAKLQEPYLVLDINPGSNDSRPYGLTKVDNTLFFAGYDSNGRELWQSDGTEAGTVLVRDISPGDSSTDLQFLTDMNGMLFFWADDGSHGLELWKSNGTEAGTVLVKDINPGSGHSAPTSITEVNGSIFFAADDGIHGPELWASDGSESGTVLVRDAVPGSYGSYPQYLRTVNGLLYYSATDLSSNGYGRELWKSDGTEAGTAMVKDINTGSGSSSEPLWLTEMDSTLFFSADDGNNGRELWRSDGTEQGTILVKDIHPGSGDSSPSVLTNVHGTLFFQADDGVHGVELWRSDGTEQGTILVRDINPGSGDSSPAYLTKVNDTLFFRATDGNNGYELWKSDGTEAGTSQVQDTYPGSSGSEPEELTGVSGVIFFRADDGSNGNELWALVAQDLVLTKTVQPSAPISPGMPITYSLTFSNAGHATATGIVITDIVPDELVNVDFESNHMITPSCRFSYTWSVGNLAVAEGGIITVTGSVSVTLSPGYSFTNTATITSTTTEGAPANNSDWVRMVINTPPVAIEDMYTATQGIPLVVSAPGVLNNDSDVDADLLAAILATPPLSGTLRLALDGSFVYTPTLDFTDTVTFTYHATDGKADSNLAMATLVVKPPSMIYLPLVLRQSGQEHSP